MDATEDTIAKIEQALASGQPFAAWAMPGEKEVKFLTRELTTRQDASAECRAVFTEENWNGFFINFFANEEDYTTGIGENDEPFAADAAARPDIQPTSLSTSKAEHGNMVRLVVARLAKAKAHEGKVVIARVIAEESPKSPARVFQELCREFPDTFRYICHTPETGTWLAATPEVLLDYDVETARLDTMALAGTRDADQTGPWDEKNYNEHRYVVTDILHSLNNAGFQAVRIPPELSLLHLPAQALTAGGDLRYGKIAHRFTPICAKLRNSSRLHAQSDLDKVFKLLSPTPAVCGYPFGDSLRDIIELEAFQRHCYGGYVGVKQGSRTRAFVNLRCAFAAPADGGYLYNIYAGGGITADSDPEQEWLETEKKSQTMLAAVRE